LAEQFARPIATANKLIANKLPDLVTKMLELASGVVVQEIDPKTGEERIYTQPPDRKACEYLLNRIMGRPIQPQEVSGPGGGEIPLNERLIDDIMGRIGAAGDAEGGGEDAG
jgi:hypothetical protein